MKNTEDQHVEVVLVRSKWCEWSAGVILLGSGATLLPTKVQHLWMNKKGLKSKCILGFPKKQILRWNLAWITFINVLQLSTCGRGKAKQESGQGPGQGRPTSREWWSWDRCSGFLSWAKKAMPLISPSNQSPNVSHPVRQDLVPRRFPAAEAIPQDAHSWWCSSSWQ